MFMSNGLRKKLLEILSKTLQSHAILEYILNIFSHLCIAYRSMLCQPHILFNGFNKINMAPKTVITIPSSAFNSIFKMIFSEK